jgi:hypothetical protein
MSVTHGAWCHTPCVLSLLLNATALLLCFSLELIPLIFIVKLVLVLGLSPISVPSTVLSFQSPLVAILHVLLVVDWGL